jgi:microcystin degradation protein MlrC
VYIVATAKVAENREPQLYRSLGLEPASAQVVVVKSPLGFRAAYESIAHDIMIVDAPGSVTPHLTTIPFTRLRRPLFPLDADMEWRPADASRPYSGLLSRRKRA